METKILKAAALFTDKRSIDPRVNYVNVTSIDNDLFVWATNKVSVFISRIIGVSHKDVNLKISPKRVAALANLQLSADVENQWFEDGDASAKDLLLRVGLRQFSHDRGDPVSVTYSAEELNLAAKANKILTGSKESFYIYPANRPTNAGAIVIKEDVTYVFIMPLSENTERFSKPSWVQE